MSDTSAQVCLGHFTVPQFTDEAQQGPQLNLVIDVMNTQEWQKMGKGQSDKETKLPGTKWSGDKVTRAGDKGIGNKVTGNNVTGDKVIDE